MPTIQYTEPKKLSRFENKIVDKSMFLFEKKLNNTQQKLFFYMLIAEKNGDSLQGMEWSKLARLLEIKAAEKYSVTRKKKIITDITSVKVWHYIDEKNMGSHVIFPSFELIDDKIQYSINEKFKELFKLPSVNYYVLNYDMIKNFKHKNSIMIYQLLNKELDANEENLRKFIFSYEFLKSYLNAGDYSGKEFKRTILDPCLKEINELTDISIEGEINKRTKKKQISSKYGDPEMFHIGGIRRKSEFRVQNYMQQVSDEYADKQNKGRTKSKKITTKNEYTEPVYETFEGETISEIEANALINNVFEVATADVKKIENVENLKDNIENILDNVEFEISDELKNKEKLKKELPKQHENEIVLKYEINGDPFLERIEQLYKETEHLYYSYHAGKINAETAAKELRKKEFIYKYELTHEEKIELNQKAKEKWEAIPF